MVKTVIKVNENINLEVEKHTDESNNIHYVVITHIKGQDDIISQPLHYSEKLQFIEDIKQFYHFVPNPPKNFCGLQKGE